LIIYFVCIHFHLTIFFPSIKHSIKTQHLIVDLKKELESGIKSIVFSQWTSMLDLVEIALDQEGIQYARLDGTMNQKTRIRFVLMRMLMKTNRFD